MVESVVLVVVGVPGTVLSVAALVLAVKFSLSIGHGVDYILVQMTHNIGSACPIAIHVLRGAMVGVTILHGVTGFEEEAGVGEGRGALVKVRDELTLVALQAELAALRDAGHLVHHGDQVRGVVSTLLPFSVAINR